MAKKTIDELARQVKAAEDAKEALRKEINGLKEQKTEVHNAAQTAAEGGNVDLYLEKHRAEEHLDAEIFVKEIQLKKPVARPSDEEIRMAWEDYAKGYNKDFEKALAEYQQARRSLYERYIRLVQMQNTALKRRRLCGQLTGNESLSGFKMSRLNGENVYGLRWKTYQLLNADVVFFLSSGEATESDETLFNSVIRTLTPVD